MASSQDWKKAQAERLEWRRGLKLEERRIYEEWEQAHKELTKQKKQSEDWKWGSWWWGWSWSQGGQQANWWTSTGASSTQKGSPPPPTAEPTASIRPQAPWEQRNRDPGEDKADLRLVALTPASFMPQRHVAMALGRPVVVLRGVRTARGLSGWVVLCGEVRGCWLSGGVEWAGLRCRGVGRLAWVGRGMWLPAVG